MIKGQEIEIFVMPVLEIISNLFPRVEKFWNQNKIPVPQEVERFFYLRSSILSYLIFSDAFGYKSVFGPNSLIDNLKELEEMQKQNVGKEISTFKIVKPMRPTPSFA